MQFGDSTRMYQLSRLTLKGKSNWQLWKTDVFLSTKFQRVDRILKGLELPPSAPTTIPSDANEEEVTNYQNQMTKFLAIEESYSSRESGLHLALNNCMDEHHRVMTMHCSTPKEIWQYLTGVYENKGKGHILDLIDKFDRIKLEDPSEIPRFLDELKATHLALRTAGKGYDDDELSLRIVKKFPDSMDGLKTMLKYGHQDMMKLDNLTSTLIRYHQDRRSESSSLPCEVAAIARDKNRMKRPKRIDKSRSRCHSCQQIGHWRSECPNAEKPRFDRNRSETTGKKSREQAHIALCAIADQDLTSRSSWIIDTAATATMSPYVNPDEMRPKEILIGNGGSITSPGVKLDMDIGQLKLKEVLVVPELHANLLSVGNACDDGVIDEAVFKKDSCELKLNGAVIASGSRQGRLYVLDGTDEDERASAMMSIDRWHERLCHVRTGTIVDMAKSKTAKGIEVGKTGRDVEDTCEVCIATKTRQKPYPHRSDTRATAPGLVLHVDLCGPMEVESEQGSRYAMPVTDDFSRFTIVYFLKRKSDAIDELLNAIKMVENHTGNKVVSIRADNGGEFVSKLAKQSLRKLGISLLTSVPYSPQQNGVAERKNQTLVKRSRAALRMASMPKHYWQYAMATATHVTNRVATTANGGKTPNELWTGVVPDLSHIRVFGCKVFGLIPKQRRRGKFSDISSEGVFLGYPYGQKGYLIMDYATRRKYVCRNVEFIEYEFPFSVRDVADDDGPCDTSGHHKNDEVDSPSTVMEIKTETPRGESPIILATDDDSIVDDRMDTDINEPPPSDDFESPMMLDDSDERRHRGTEIRPVRPPRNRNPPARLIDEIEDFRMKARRHNALIMIDETDEPKSLDEALHDEKWKSAMDREYQSLMRNQTWDLVPLPEGRNTIAGKWVFKAKTDESGHVTRHKARYVARGFSQAAGVDFDETYSPVISHTSLRMMLSLAASMNLEIYQMDVDTAYLYGVLEEELYLQQPGGYEIHGENGEKLVCRLRKAIYGLKQAGRCWWKNLDSFLKEEGFGPVSTEPCLYKKGNSSSCMMMIAVYVDDLIVAATTKTEIMEIEELLSSKYSIKPAVVLRFVLGIRVRRDRRSRLIYLDQCTYSNAILTKFGMAESNRVKTPAEVRNPAQEDDQVDDGYPYRELIGALMYLMICTRPDLSYSVSIAARKSHRPSTSDVAAVKRILRYLKGTVNVGLRLGGSHITLKAFADADFAADTESRRSISGYVLFLGAGPISWTSRKQQLVTLSTVESEYVSLSEAAREVIWLRGLLSELGFVQDGPTTIFQDNRGTIAMAGNLKSSRRSKHVDIKFHFIKEKIESNEIVLKHCPSEEMVADIATKALGPNLFLKHKDHLCAGVDRVALGREC